MKPVANTGLDDTDIPNVDRRPLIYLEKMLPCQGGDLWEGVGWCPITGFMSSMIL